MLGINCLFFSPLIMLQNLGDAADRIALVSLFKTISYASSVGHLRVSSITVKTVL